MAGCLDRVPSRLLSVTSDAASCLDCVVQPSFVPSLAQAWLATEAYIAKARPRVVLLENLTALMTEYEPGDTSDSDYIVKKLSSFGYQARVPCLGFVSAGCVDPGFVRICVSSS